LSARVRANRLNAKKSTGPKTQVGKRLVALNALQHGLSRPISLDPLYAVYIDRLARLVAGEGASEAREVLARQIAETEYEIIRVRHARHMLLSDARIEPYKLSGRDWQHMGQLLDETEPQENSFSEIYKILVGHEAQRSPPKLEEALSILGEKLRKLDRYERRALSSRKFAIREFDLLCIEESRI
jgi:hypothetical protein